MNVITDDSATVEPEHVLAYQVADFQGNVKRGKRVYGWHGDRGYHALAEHLIHLGWTNPRIEAAKEMLNQSSQTGGDRDPVVQDR